MPSLSSCDYVFDMPGDIELECISISYFEDEMGHPTAKAVQGTSGSGALEADLEEQPPIFEDAACNISKIIRLSWYTIYEEFSKKDIPETQEDFQVYINVKKSKLHNVVAHPPVFLCTETIEWIL